MTQVLPDQSSNFEGFIVAECTMCYRHTQYLARGFPDFGADRVAEVLRVKKPQDESPEFHIAVHQALDEGEGVGYHSSSRWT